MNKSRSMPARPMAAPGGKDRPASRKGVFARLLKLLFRSFPVLLPVAAFCILFNAVAAAVPAIFQQKVIAVIEQWFTSGDWPSAKAQIVPLLTVLGGLYVLAALSSVSYSQLMARITQGFLYKVRRAMFNGMQDLPIRYFDTHRHGDIMSYYTNDTDTLRQLVSQALPSLLRSGVVITCVFCIMLYYSLWMTLLVLLGVGHGDTRAEADKLWGKLRGLRINEDENGKTNLALADVDGEVLVVSQFTLFADCRHGRRPSFTDAGAPDVANELYEYFLTLVCEDVEHVAHGIFGADMKVDLVNDGPFTIVLDTDNL